MNFKMAILLMIIPLVSIPSSSIRLKASRFKTFNVIDYGASGNGQVDDSQAFLKAWGDICKAKKGTPTLVIPKGKTFLLKPLSFNGPCKSNIVNIQLQGNIVAPNSINSWTKKNIWIDFNDVKGLVLNGGGQIDGRGAIWWKACGYTILQDDPSCQRPTALHFNNCDSLLLSDITHINSPRNHIGIDNCNGVHVSNLYITAPKESPNTDGIDISGSTNVYIENSMIGTGDDCIAINHGSSFINIIGLFCGPGHGISVGSLGANGAYQTVEEVHVQNCTLHNTQNGVRIKTWQGGSGFARKITFEHISIEASQNPIIIDQYYTELDGAPNKQLQKAVAISEVRYSDVYGTSADLKAINLDCSESIGCTDIEFDNISITSAYASGKSTFSYCNNAHGKASSTQPAVPCLLP